jgi:phosphoglucosamine mutase
MGKMFGTDGVRGIANTELTPQIAFDLGFYGAVVLAGAGSANPRILVGQDSRLSGDMLQAALVAGITSSGADVYLAGTVPTPGIAYLTQSQGFDAGVMISASHNAYNFNGIKFFNSEGFKLADEVEEEIEAYISGEKTYDQPPKVGDQLGRSHLFRQGQMLYMQHLKDSMGLDLSGLKIALDCANGAASHIAPALYRELGAEPVTIAAQPDGLNINHECGSTNLEALCRTVIEEECDLGFAFDGDADRMLAVDHTGTPVDGDKIMLIIAKNRIRKQLLPENTLVVTVMSNLGMHVAAKQLGINLVVTKVGDRYVLEEMLANGYGFGGEQSGHLIILQHATTGDGIMSSLALLHALSDSRTTLREAAEIMHVYPQVLVPAFIPNERKEAAMEDAEVLEMIRQTEDLLGADGRVLVRPSGTEPQIRVMIEGDDQDQIHDLAQQIADVIVTKYAEPSEVGL